MVRAAGAREVHLRISSPQVAWPCYYGIDTPTRSELIAQSHTVDEINQYLTSDTLAYLPLDETQAAVLGGVIHDGSGDVALNGSGELALNGSGDVALDGHARKLAPSKRSLNVVPGGNGKADRFCHACFSGDYPVPFQEMPKSRQMRLLDF
jgi:amidophosphoribosyltransferase